MRMRLGAKTARQSTPSHGNQMLSTYLFRLQNGSDVPGFPSEATRAGTTACLMNANRTIGIAAKAHDHSQDCLDHGGTIPVIRAYATSCPMCSFA